jgi:hypothetical protein
MDGGRAKSANHLALCTRKRQHGVISVMPELTPDSMNNLVRGIANLPGGTGTTCQSGQLIYLAANPKHRLTSRHTTKCARVALARAAWHMCHWLAVDLPVGKKSARQKCHCFDSLPADKEPTMTTLVSIALTLGVIASLLLAGFGVAGLLRQSMKPLRAWLMIAAGIVTLMNVMMVAPMLSATP